LRFYFNFSLDSTLAYQEGRLRSHKNSTWYVSAPTTGIMVAVDVLVIVMHGHIADVLSLFALFLKNNRGCA